jgi:hypothetical protein
LKSWHQSSTSSSEPQGPETTTFTAGYSRYFVPPAFELVAEPTINLFANTTAAPAITQDTTSKAERDHYFDVGASQIILPGLKVGVDAYYKLANNLIDEGQFGAPIPLTPVNYHHGIVKGVEALLSYEVGDWSFYGNFAASKVLGKEITSSQFSSPLTSLPLLPATISTSTTIRPTPIRPASNTGCRRLVRCFPPILQPAVASGPPAPAGARRGRACPVISR